MNVEQKGTKELRAGHRLGLTPMIMDGDGFFAGFFKPRMDTNGHEWETDSLRVL